MAAAKERTLILTSVLSLLKHTKHMYAITIHIYVIMAHITDKKDGGYYNSSRPMNSIYYAASSFILFFIV